MEIPLLLLTITIAMLYWRTDRNADNIQTVSENTITAHVILVGLIEELKLEDKFMAKGYKEQIGGLLSKDNCDCPDCEEQNG
jgi:hypothetical protein